MAAATENTLIRSLVTDQALLIGATDATTEGTFVWGSGEPFVYTNWASGEPNDSNNEDCVEIYATGLWNDRACSSPAAYVCEVPGF